MFTHIKTSAENKETVTILTRKFGLGAENVIARIAIAYSLQCGATFSPLEVKDSGGKEYSKSVLFGNLFPLYAAIMCKHYGIRMSDKNMSRYFKLHLDDGLQRIMDDIKNNPNLIGYDYLFDKIQKGLSALC